MREALILDAVRTPIGRYAGTLASVRPDDLAARAIAATVERTGLPPDEVDDVVVGCTNGAGEDNRNVARMGLLLAGLPVEVPGVTVNRLCASGLEAVSQAARAIKVGEGDLMLAGGVESMSRSPFVMLKPERSFPRGQMDLVDTTIGWRFVNPHMAERYSTESMGETAENVAERYEVSREDQDAFALESHRRAVDAQESGRFDDEIVTVDAPQPKGPPVTVHSDEGPRPELSSGRERHRRAVPRARSATAAERRRQCRLRRLAARARSEGGRRQVSPRACVRAQGDAGTAGRAAAHGP